MFHLLDVHHMRHLFHFHHEEETARPPARARDNGHPRAPRTIAHHHTSPRDELAVFGLIDQGAESPPSLCTPDDLSARDNLSVFSLHEAQGPKSGQCIDSVSAWGLLRVLGLMP